MTLERWQRLTQLFHAALECAGEEQMDYLREHCSDDPSLRLEVERLLRAHQRANGFTRRAVEEARRLLGDAGPGMGPGVRVGAYRILEELGHGGMGTVYLAERADAVFEKHVAIKVIKRGMGTDAVLRRFQDERRILAGLEHPNIARLLDGGTSASGLPFFVMEYIDGQPIDEFCRIRQLATPERLQLFRQVCAAVAYAHQHLIVHRDIKPSNILVTADGVPKLLDFGIAKIMHAEPAGDTIETQATMVFLTPDYASPEHVQGRPVTTLSDVYSLGVVLYRLLTGRHPYPFTSRTPEDVVRTIATADPVWPSAAVRAREAEASTGPARPREDAVPGWRQLRGDLDTIVLKAIQKEPARRYQSAEQLADEIRRYLAGLPVQARPDTLVYRAAKFVRRNRAAAIGGLLVSVSVSGGMAATAWQARRAVAQEQVARTEQARAERRFAEVRALARSLLFEYHDAIRDLPGATPVRERLVRDALAYLDGLAGDVTGDATLQRELAAAYDRVGDIQGGTLFANLGDTLGAIESHQKALALREQLAATDSQALELASELALSHRKLALLYWETGELQRALAHAQRAATVLRAFASQASAPTELRLDLAKTYDYLGRMVLEHGDAARALDHLLAAGDILEALLTLEPDSRALLRSLSVLREQEATVHHFRGDLDAALAHHHEALALRERLAGDSPLNTDYQRLVAVSAYNIGEVLSAMGRTQAALDSYRRNLAIAERLSVADPENEQFRGDVAYARIRVGDMLVALGRRADALAQYRQSLALRSADVNADPANLWKRSSLIEAHAKISSALAADSPAAALAEAERTLVMMQATTLEPQNAVIRSFFATTYADLGDLHALLAEDRRVSPTERPPRWQAARDLYGRAEDIFRDLAESGRSSSADLRRRDALPAAIARCEQNLGNARPDSR
jgi:eukaryotic-like serine/threonine-protein kinase